MARTLGDAFVRVRPDTTTFGPELASGVSSAQRGFGSKLAGFAKVAGVALGAAGAYGAVQFTKGAIALERDFGKTMSVLQATTNAPARSMRKLEKLAMDMGAATVFSANDASKAMLELARGGMNQATIRGGALQGTLTLAAAGELEMAESANIAVKSMGQFNLRGKDMKQIAAALAGGANASSASVRDMSVALSQGGLAADAVGFSIQEATGVLAAFSNAGMEGSDAGTSMKTMLDRLLPSSEKAEKTFERLGLQTKAGKNAFVDAEGEYKSAARIAELLQGATENLSSSERKKALSVMFGSDAQRAATVLAKEGAEGLRPLIKATSDQDAAQRMAQANMKGTAGALETMSGSVETAQLAWGKAIKPLTMFGAQVVTQIANGAVPIIEDFGGVLRRNLKNVDLSSIGRSLQKVDVGKIFGSIKRSFQGINWNEVGDSFRKLGQSMKETGPELRKARQELPTLTDGLKVGGVVVRFLAKHLDTLAKMLPAIAAGFIAFKVAQAASHVAAAASVPVRIAEVFAIRAQTAALRQHGAAMVVSTGATNAGTVAQGRSRVAMIATAVTSRASAVATKAMAVAQRILNAAMRANPIGLIITALIALGAGLVLAYKKSATFRRIVNAAWSGIKAAAVAVWNWFKDKFIPFFTKTIPGAFRAVVDWVKQNWDVILALITGPIGLAVLAVRRNWDKIKGAFVFVWNWLKDTWSKGYAKIKEWISGPVDAAKGLLDKVLDKIKGGFRSAVSGVKSIWGKLQDVARKPVEFIINTVYNDGIRKMVNFLPGIPDLPELHFERGGEVPGWTARTGDTVRARLRPKEHVWTEDEVAGVPGGHHGMKRMRELAKRRRLARTGDPGWDLAPGFAAGGFPLDRMAHALSWAQAQEGKPYIWGGTGPGGFDCSGFMSGIANVLSGGSGFGTRYGTTASFPWGGFKPGYGEFTIGNSKSFGHMGGTLGGIEVESTNGSVRMGPEARGAADSMFSERYHLGAGGMKYAGSGGSSSLLSVVGDVKDVLGNIQDWFSRLLNMGGFGGMIQRMAEGLGNKVIGFINDKIPDWGPIPNNPIPSFDRGGKARGRGLVLKDTWRPERMLSPEETNSYDQIGALIREMRSGRRRPVRLVVDGREFRAYLEEVADEAVGLAADFDDHYARGGR
jgi:TP901 family phage tail tape measure protein